MFGKQTKTIVVGLVLVGLTALMGCSSLNSGGKVTPAAAASAYRIVPDGNGGYNFQDENGQPVATKEVTDKISAGESVEFGVPIEPGEDMDSTRWEVEKWGWRLRVRTDNHDIVSPCYSGKWIPHLNLDLQEVRSGRYVAQLHVWMFWRDGGPKLGIWDRSSGYCKAVDRSYGATKDNIQNCLSRYMPVWIAALLAAAAAWLVIYVLIPCGALVFA